MSVKGPCVQTHFCKGVQLKHCGVTNVILKWGGGELRVFLNLGSMFTHFAKWMIHAFKNFWSGGVKPVLNFKTVLI